MTDSVKLAPLRSAAATIGLARALIGAVLHRPMQRTPRRLAGAPCGLAIPFRKVRFRTTMSAAT